MLLCFLNTDAWDSFRGNPDVPETVGVILLLDPRPDIRCDVKKLIEERLVSGQEYVELRGDTII